MWKLSNTKSVNVNDIQYQRCQWRRSSVFIVNCKHISNFVLIVDFEQANVCLIHIENANIMCYFKCEQNLLRNSLWSHMSTTLWVNQWEIFAKEFAHTFQSLRCPKGKVYNEASVCLGWHHSWHQRENFGF